MALKLWVEFFEDLQHVRGRSQNTVMAYRRDLEMYEEFLGTKRELARFYEFMKDKKLSPRSQARVISSLRTYLRYLETQGEKVPELRELRPPRVKPGLPKPITLSEFHLLFEACKVEDPHRSFRNQLTLLLLFGLGCRVSELVGLNLHDFNVTDGWLKVLGKGGKERLVPLSENLLEQLKIYVRDVRGHLVKDETPSILINDRGHRPSRVDVWRWLAAWSARAGFEEPIGPHQFRHGCATALLEGGADLRTIQVLLGHSSLQTTQIYTSVTTHKMKDEVDKNHPLSGVRSLDDV
jgi:integrase/recombinase XerD